MDRNHTVRICAIVAVLLAAASLAPGAENQAAKRCSIWVDAYQGEPVPYRDVLDDLATARVIYLGESHTVKRHHEIQARIVRDLAQKGLPLVLGLEQMEARCQPSLDRYCRREIDFDQLAEAIQWQKQWRNYDQYRPILEAARSGNVPIRALNAPAETIGQVARGGGLSKLDPQSRAQLPPEVWLDEPPYQRLLELRLKVHLAATPERLQPMIEAQICRDEAMAAALADYLTSAAGKGRTAIVLCGSGHVAYGLGTASRLRRRIPEVTDRIVIFSASGDIELTDPEQAASRPIHITHDQLRHLPRPLANYLHVTSLSDAATTE